MIVGRSNVGKSTLYNRLLGKKEAITGEEYGLTRDYQSQICALNDIEFNLIDTAGYNLKQNELSKKINDNIAMLIDKPFRLKKAKIGSIIAEDIQDNINATFSTFIILLNFFDTINPSL